MLKKRHHFWLRTVLPLAVLPVLTFLVYALPELESCEALVAEGWPGLPPLDMPEFWGKTFLKFLGHIFSLRSAPYTFGALAASCLLGDLWLHSTGRRRVFYYLLLFLLTVSLPFATSLFAALVHL